MIPFEIVPPGPKGLPWGPITPRSTALPNGTTIWSGLYLMDLWGHLTSIVANMGGKCTWTGSNRPLDHLSSPCFHLSPRIPCGSVAVDLMATSASIQQPQDRACLCPFLLPCHAAVCVSANKHSDSCGDCADTAFWTVLSHVVHASHSGSLNID